MPVSLIFVIFLFNWLDIKTHGKHRAFDLRRACLISLTIMVSNCRISFFYGCAVFYHVCMSHILNLVISWWTSGWILYPTSCLLSWFKDEGTYEMSLCWFYFVWVNSRSVRTGWGGRGIFMFVYLHCSIHSVFDNHHPS